MRLPNGIGTWTDANMQCMPACAHCDVSVTEKSCVPENSAFSKCVLDQAKPRNVAGLVSNLLVDKTQGTNNEGFHKFANEMIRSYGGSRQLNLISAGLCFAAYLWNGRSTTSCV